MSLTHFQKRWWMNETKSTVKSDIDIDDMKWKLKSVHSTCAHGWGWQKLSVFFKDGNRKEVGISNSVYLSCIFTYFFRLWISGKKTFCFLFFRAFVFVFIMLSSYIHSHILKMYLSSLKTDMMMQFSYKISFSRWVKFQPFLEYFLCNQLRQLLLCMGII
jgi:hypothetical protein